MKKQEKRKEIEDVLGFDLSEVDPKLDLFETGLIDSLSAVQLLEILNEGVLSRGPLEDLSKISTSEKILGLLVSMQD